MQRSFYLCLANYLNTHLGIGSLVHTHQQNGSVLRKHRHVVDTGLFLIAGAFLPRRFCGEAFVSVILSLIEPSRLLDEGPLNCLI